MRILIALTVILATAWGGYWFVQARARDQALNAWMQDRQAAGWQAETSDIAMHGFPNRLDATLSDIRLVAPDQRFVWSAPFLQTLQLVYEPRRMIIVWPHTQTFGSGPGAVTLTSQDMRASLTLSGKGRAWDHATLEGTGMALSAQHGNPARVDKFIAAMRTRDAASNQFDVAVTATGVQPPSAILGLLHDQGVLPDRLETLELDASVTLDQPVSLKGLTDARPAIQAIKLRKLRAKWGDLQLRGGGDLTISTDGTPAGEITLQAKNWREMLTLAVTSGAIPADIAGPLESGLQILAMSSGNSQTLDAPLTIRGGLIYLGPIPLGPAPKIILP